jgi:RND family efflux transporter MFP subunit
MKAIQRALLAALLLCACSPASAQAVAAATQPFAEIAIYPEREAFATVLSLNDSRIAAEVSARILEIPVEVGQVVERGAVLVRLDGADFELAVRQAEAALEAVRARARLARSQLERARALVEQGFVSSEALNQRESEARAAAADVRANEAALASARRSLGKTVVRAPFRAIVRERLANVGEIASPGTQLLRVLDASRIEVSAQVQSEDAAELPHVKQITFVDQAGVQYPLRLVRVVPALDPRERSQEARLRFAGKAALPGSAGPVASAIMWGLGFATILTLFVIPLLYRMSWPAEANRQGLAAPFAPQAAPALSRNRERWTPSRQLRGEACKHRPVADSAWPEPLRSRSWPAHP